MYHTLIMNWASPGICNNCIIHYPTHVEPTFAFILQRMNHELGFTIEDGATRSHFYCNISSQIFGLSSISTTLLIWSIWEDGKVCRCVKEERWRRETKITLFVICVIFNMNIKYICFKTISPSYHILLIHLLTLLHCYS